MLYGEKVGWVGSGEERIGSVIRVCGKEWDRKNQGATLDRRRLTRW